MSFNINIKLIEILFHLMVMICFQNYWIRVILRFKAHGVEAESRPGSQRQREGTEEGTLSSYQASFLRRKIQPFLNKTFIHLLTMNPEKSLGLLLASLRDYLNFDEAHYLSEKLPTNLCFVSKKFCI